MATLEGLAQSGPDSVGAEQPAGRIARRMLKAVEAGQTEYGVRGGLLGLLGTTHGPEVYSDVADALSDRGVEIEAHRFRSTVPVSFGDEGPVPPVDRHVNADVISVTAIGGKVVDHAQEPSEREGHVRQLYPPEADPSDTHNLSLGA